MEQVKALTHGRGADYTMEAATLASAVPQTIRAARRAGTVVLTSVERGDAEVTVPQLALSVEGRAILGAQNGNVRMRHDLPRFIRMMEDGWLDPRADHHHALPARPDRRRAPRLGGQARPERRDRARTGGLVVATTTAIPAPEPQLTAEEIVAAPARCMSG